MFSTQAAGGTVSRKHTVPKNTCPSPDLNPEAAPLGEVCSSWQTFKKICLDPRLNGAKKRGQKSHACNKGVKCGWAKNI